MNSEPYRKRYKTWGIITLASVYFLILIGGVVRSTGSGMGCPDWPKCFGKWIPPTEISELPSDYKQIYADKRKQKNIKLARVLSKLNLINLSNNLVNDDAMYYELDFNSTKTWIEYLNRVLGVLVGIFIFVLTILSFKFLGNEIGITLKTIAAFVAVGLEGWIGSIVVSTNLLPFAITIHMFLAIALIALLIYTIIKSQSVVVSHAFVGFSKVSYYLLGFITVLTCIQILLGSQVRESVDQIAIGYGHINRNLWIGQLGNSFYVHRSFSLLILILNIYFLYNIHRQFGKSSTVYKISLGFNILLWMEVSLGILMAYVSIPPFSQPLHLFVATLIFGLQFSLLTFYWVSKSRSLEKSSIHYAL